MSGRAEIWTISTRKGGVLKTTLAVNIAGVLAAQNKKVLLVDMDSQGNVLISFGKNPDQVECTVRDLLTGELPNPYKTIVKVHDYIDVIPANEEMGNFEFEVIPNKDKYPDQFDLLKDALDFVVYGYDYIIIDTPPNFGLIQGNALRFADKVIVPFQPESYSMRALIKILDTIEDFKNKFNPDLELMGVVATLVDMRTSLHSEIMATARRFCQDNNIPMMDTIIPKSIRYASSIAYHESPATLALPSHKVSECYFELVEEVLQNV